MNFAAFKIWLVFFVVLGCLGVQTSQPTSEVRPTAPAAGAQYVQSDFPPRPRGALTGSQFIATLAGKSRGEKEAAIYDQISKGNIPDFLRKLKAVNLSFRDRAGAIHTATVWVFPDYLAIGSDRDFIRIPMTPATAEKIAERFGYVLPTRRLVDEIYRQAAIKITPQPLPAGSQMVTDQYFQRHQAMIESQLKNKPRGLLTAGHKKDIVMTNRLIQFPNRVAIYGWHRSVGRAIQPLSTFHINTYVDYSHGVRLVKRALIVDKKRMFMKDVMASTSLAGLVSDEGTLSTQRLKGILLSTAEELEDQTIVAGE